LLEYSDYPIVIFTINFDISEVSNPFKNNENVYFINYSDDLSPDEAVILQTDYGKYVDRKFDSTYKILSMKSKVLLKAFELGIIEGVYLDSDSVARYNIDDLMLEIKNVKNYPLLSRGVYEVMLDENGNGDIERPLMNYLGVKERSMMYVQSNIVVFTNQCKEFMEEWKKTCEDETILLNFEKWAPYQDETVANVLLWKHGYTEHLPMYHFNIRNPRFVEEFEKFDDIDKSKYSKEMLGFPFYIDGVQMNWSYIPYDKDDVKVFHGIKKLDEMIDIIEYQNRIKKDICMIQMHDDLYSPLAEITKKVNKEYCDLHGYDYICYDKRVIDDEKTFHWQRYPMIKRHLRNYKWMFFLDIDAMIMNYNIKLEDLIDDKYDIIMENMGDSTDIVDETNKKYADMNYNILASAILLKNSKLSKEFLTDIYNDILHCNNTLQYDNSVVRCTIGYFDKYKKATKVFPCDSKKLNAFWYTNKPSYILRDGPKWNDMGNMFALGDFILHIVAYNTDERISLAKQFLPYVIKEIKNTTKINILQIGSHVGNTINDPIFSKVDNNSKMILVEPVPYLFNQLKDNYKNKMSDTSNIIFINKAVSNFIGEIELTVPSERNDFSKFPFWASQLASVNSNHATEHLPGIIVDKIKVKTTTIDEIINQYNIEEIDLLHTDTEGHDYVILMSYSFKIKPKKILFEHKHIDGLFTVGNKYEELSNKLKSVGYKKVYQNEEDSMFEL
jgi:FkbM family methyltransferase